MARLLCATNGLTGMLHATLELASRLRDLGHEVILASPADVGATVQAHGLPFRQLAPQTFDPAPQLPRTPQVAKLRHKWTELRTARPRRAAGVRALDADARLAELREDQPDLLLLDMELHEHILVAVGAGMPVVQLCPFFAHHEAPGIPPLQSDLRPGGAPSGQEFKRTWRRHRAQRRRAQRQQWLRYFGTDRRGVLRALSRAAGFRNRIDELDWDTVFTYPDLPCWRLTARQLDFPHDPPASVTYLGSMVPESRAEPRPHRGIGGADRTDSPGDTGGTDRVDGTGRADGPDGTGGTDRVDGTGRADGTDRTDGPDGLDGAGGAGDTEYTNDAVTAALRAARDKGQRIVFCSATTMPGDTDEFTNRLLAAARMRSDLCWILTGLPEPQARDLPAHVIGATHVPQLRVLAAADAAIVHGGIHTLHECIHHHVPMLVYSGGRYDQNGCAARIAFHGLGDAGNRSADDASTIARRLDALWNRPAVGDALRGMDRHCRAAGEPQHLAAALRTWGIDAP